MTDELNEFELNELNTGEAAETADSGTADSETADTVTSDTEPDSTPPKRDRSRMLAFGILPGLAMALAVTAGVLLWQDGSKRESVIAAGESVTAASDTTAAILSYRPETVDTELGAARDRLTGPFLDAYTKLVNDVVIPGAKQKKISAVATVPAAGSVSADQRHAVVLVFVNQTTTIGSDAPTNTTSSVRVTLDKVGQRWLVSGFDPV